MAARHLAVVVDDKDHRFVSDIVLEQTALGRGSSTFLFGRLAIKGLVDGPFAKRRKGVLIAVIDDGAKPEGDFGRWPARRRGRTGDLRPSLRAADHHVLIPFADIGAVEAVDPGSDDPPERRAIEIEDVHFEHGTDGISLGGVHIHCHEKTHAPRNTTKVSAGRA